MGDPESLQPNKGHCGNGKCEEGRKERRPEGKGGDDKEVQREQAKTKGCRRVAAFVTFLEVNAAKEDV